MRETLSRGFTTVRDLAGADHGLARAQEEGLLAGPRIFYCGHALSQTGGHGDMRLPGEDHGPGSRGCCGIGTVVDGVRDRERRVEGKSVSERVVHGGRRMLKKKK